MKVISARIDEKDFEDLEVIGKEEKTDKAEVMRKLLALAIKEWKVKKALELVRSRKVTIRKAAAFAGVSYVEMMDLISKEGIDSGYGLEDLRRDFKRR